MRLSWRVNYTVCVKQVFYPSINEATVTASPSTRRCVSRGAARNTLSASPVVITRWLWSPTRLVCPLEGAVSRSERAVAEKKAKQPHRMPFRVAEGGTVSRNCRTVGKSIY